MGTELYSLKIGDPHIAFTGTWDTFAQDNDVCIVDALRFSGMQAFAYGDYSGIGAACQRMRDGTPAEGYIKCARLMADLPLKAGPQIIKARRDGLTDLLALSESQAAMLRAHITVGDMRDDYAILANTYQALEERLREDAAIESFDWDHVPRERPLFLFGSASGENFRYTVARNGDRLGHDLLTRKDPLEKMAQECEGSARYFVSRIPGYATRLDELRRFLLGAYASIKRQVSREGLSHYPLLFATNA